MSFLDRLKKKQVVPTTPEDAKQAQLQAQVQAAAPAAHSDAVEDERLKVDIYKAPEAIIVYAQLGGARMDSYDVLVQGDDDTVIIKGQRVRPEGEPFKIFSIEGKEKVLEECSWGKFYRQIILPAQVDPEQTQAVMRDSVLMIYLPLRGHANSGIHVHVNRV
jgi:HSP20 family molecular chaperone IbpA